MEPFKDTVPIFQTKTDQQMAVETCPIGCEPSWTVRVTPKTPGPGKLAFARCLHCLTYWQVKSTGEIVNVRYGPGVTKKSKKEKAK